jgi:hypothetical protein
MGVGTSAGARADGPRRSRRLGWSIEAVNILGSLSSGTILGISLPNSGAALWRFKRRHVDCRNLGVQPTANSRPLDPQMTSSLPRGADHSTLGASRPVPIAWSLLALAGLSFWFLLGFPFGHHNESYFWVPIVGASDPWAAILYRFHGPGSLRPLGLGLAWLFFHMPGGGLVAVQLFNFLTTAYAWWTLSRAANEPRTFALAALLSGGALFSGYIYVFHLHGIFYGPMLVSLAWTVRAAVRPPSRRSLALLTASALLVSGFHAFTLVFYLACVMGLAVEALARGDRRAWIALGVGASLLVAWLVIQAPLGLVHTTGTRIWRLFWTFHLVEVNRAASAVVLLLTLATVAGTRWPDRRWGWAAGVGVIGAAVVLFVAHAPLGFMLVVAATLKAVIHRRWALASLLAVSLGLPYAGAQGSPAYAIYALALCTFTLAFEWPAAETRLSALRPVHALVGVAAIGLLVGTLRLGIAVPGVSALAQPMLRESERTHQLEGLLRRLMASPWRAHPVRFADEEANLATATQLDRRWRSPSQRIPVNRYLDFERGPAAPEASPLVISFGGFPVPAGTRVMAVPGHYGGEAVVYALPDSAVLRSGGPAR